MDVDLDCRMRMSVLAQWSPSGTMLSMPVCFYNQMLRGLSLLNPEVYGCLLLENYCAAWHVVFFTVLHAI